MPFLHNCNRIQWDFCIHFFSNHGVFLEFLKSMKKLYCNKPSEQAELELGAGGGDISTYSSTYKNLMFLNLLRNLII